MSVWLCLPSKRSPEETEPVFSKWREMGYKIAIQRDPLALTLNGESVALPEDGDLNYCRPYAGYAEAVNFLAKEVLQRDSSCDWIVTCGDDTLPEPGHAAEFIAAQCSDHFGLRAVIRGIASDADFSKGCPGVEARTFGVMQPTGDAWEDSGPRGDGKGEKRLIRRVAGSPWLGREWCLRANQGKGPLWPNFYHMFADECLQEVATKLGVFWQREDLTHFHQHWGRPREGERVGRGDRMPEFLTKANSREEWLKSKAEFERLKAGGFAECLPI